MADKDRLTEIEASLRGAEQGKPWNSGPDIRWLVSEVKRLRQGLYEVCGHRPGPIKTVTRLPLR